MERITKTLSLQAWIADGVQQLAGKEKRSFTKEVEFLLEKALERQKEIESIHSNKTQIDMDQIEALR